MMRFDGRIDPYIAMGGYRDNRRFDYPEDSRFEKEGDFRYDGRHDYPHEFDMSRGGYDRAYEDSRRGGRRDGHGKRLSEEKVEKWIKSLLSEMEDRDRQQMKMDAVLKRAQDMGIEFEKFSPEEFYATVLMVFTDFSKALGSNALDTYIKMAKLWLCDPDASVRYSKKLAAYYDNIVDEF